MTTSFADALRGYMTANDLTQQQAADLIGVGQSVVARWLSGAEPEYPSLAKIAAGLNVAVSVTPDGVTFEDNAPGEFRGTAITGMFHGRWSDLNRTPFDMDAEWMP